MDLKAWLKRVIDSAWAVGLVTLVGGALSTVVVYYFPDNPAARTASITLIVALVATNLARVVNSARDEIKEETELARGLVQRAIDVSEMGRLAGEIRNPFLHLVATRVMTEARTALRQLAGRADNQFRTHGEYMAWATPHILRLTAQSRVLAVCGDKDWNDQAVKNFNRANCEAALAGCRVERIFLQFDAKGFPTGEQRVLDDHLKAKRANGNIAAYVVPPRAAARLAAHYGLPTGFGFTFIDSGAGPAVVLLHWGFTDNSDEGLRIESPLVPPIIEHIYAAFRQRAFEYDGTLEPQS